jgi:hypothetical protein
MVQCSVSCISEVIMRRDCRRTRGPAPDHGQDEKPTQRVPATGKGVDETVDCQRAGDAGLRGQ